MATHRLSPRFGLTVASLAALAWALCLALPVTASLGAAHTRLVFAASGRLWAADPHAGVPRPFARIPRGTVDASASADGRRIAIITHRSVPYPRQGSIRTIYLWRAGHGLSKLLRLQTVADSSVAISADGRTIAYGRDNEIWAMRADGTDRRQLTEGIRRAQEPAFAPTGINLYFVRQFPYAGTAALYRRPLLIPYHSEVHLPQRGDLAEPAVSRRHLLAFMQRGGGGSGGAPDRLRVMHPNGTDVRTLTRSRDPRFDFDPAFSPSGRSIAYLRLREVNGDRAPRRYSLRTIRTSGARPSVAVPLLRMRPRGLSWTRIP